LRRGHMLESKADLARARTAGVFNRRMGHGPIQEVRG
jgi:hypothetical protein